MSDTPRTEACGFCGDHDCKPYYRPHGQECRSPLCEMTERAKKAEAEIEKLCRELAEARALIIEARKETNET